MGKHLPLRHVLFTPAWWDATWRRVVWTMIAATASVLPGLSTTPESMRNGVVFILLTSAGALVTAMVNLPEVVGNTMPVWQVVLVRVLRTAGQTLVAGGILTATALADIAWPELGRAMAVACLITALHTIGTAVLPVKDLPEVARP